MKRGSRQKVEIVARGEAGNGLARIQGYEIHVAGACVGDQVVVEISHISPHQPPRAWATLCEVLRRGASFRAPPCPHAAPLGGQCGGCPWMHWSASARREGLLQGLQRALEPVLSETVRKGLALEPAPAERGWRSRAKLIPAREGARTYLGSYARRSHEVAEMSGCLIHHPLIEKVSEALSKLLTRHQVPLYPEPGLRYVALRVGEEGVMVELIVNQWGAKGVDGVIQALQARPEICGIFLSLNDSQGNAIHSD